MALRIALCQVQDLDDDTAAYALQMGVTSVNLVLPNIPNDKGYWEIDEIVAIKRRCEGYGITLEVLENVPHDAFDKIPLGLPGRDEQLENLNRTIRNVAAAGIPMLGYHFMPNGVWRTDMEYPARGGARASAYDHSKAHLGNKLQWPQPDTTWSGRADEMILTEDELWQNYQYFLDAVLPVADEVGLLLAQHPDDPPVNQIEGYARIFTSPEAFERALAMSRGSAAWGLDLCIGTVSEMNGAESVHRMIDTFGPLDKIRYVHFRDVQGTVPVFVESFLGEGNYNPVEVIDHLLRVGFRGWLQDDHVPIMVNDTAYGHRSRAYEIGYMQGILSTR